MANYTTFINELQALTGLNHDVLVEWVNLEKGVNNNILGVTSGGHLVSYPNQFAAAVGTANLLNTSSHYAGIRANHGGTSAAQAAAIIASPWHSPSATHYYQLGFYHAGLLSSLPSGGASTPITPSPSSGATSPLSALQKMLGTLGINTSPSYVLTDAELKSYLNATQPGLVSGAQQAVIASLHGSTVSQLADKGFTDTVNPKFSTINLDIPGALTFVAVVLVGIAFLFLGGIIILKRPKGAAA